MLLQKFELLPKLLKSHDVLFQLRRHPWRVLLFLNLTQNIQIMHKQRQEALIFWMPLIGAIRFSVNHNRLLASSDFL